MLLQEGFEVTAINRLWHVDVTYIPTGEGWLYLAGVIDAFSKRVVGYAMSDGRKPPWSYRRCAALSKGAAPHLD